MKDRYIEDNFGLGIRGVRIGELENYSDKIASMSEKYNVSQYYIYRTITNLACKRRVERNKERDLEKSIEIVERWLRIKQK